MQSKDIELMEVDMNLLGEVCGGLDWEGYRMSENVEDVRGCTPMENYINPGSGHAASCDNPRFRN
ncbi:hypothetical protein [Roseateles aquatilis]|uniref:hypothetical protein n=1 Tax=Roseateles aquatilis TaxID=431061 RepID=UPI00112FE993|nr:hypothetical protein [Roseateles aquatilis]